MPQLHQTSRSAFVLGAPIVVLLAGGAFFLLGMRFKIPLVVDGVRRMNRAYMNPKQLQSAGTPGAYAGVLHHVGRKSGIRYETPLGFVSTDNGFAVLLPYGPNTDWMRNLIAAGSATVTHEGDDIEVHNPRVVPTTAMLESLPAGDRRFARLFGIKDCLVLDRTGPPT